MKSNQEYKNEKSMFAYLLMTENKLFKKARAVVKDGENFVVLYNSKKDKYALAGGGVDEGETSREACVREAFEELGINVKIIKYLSKRYYSCPIDFEGNVFISKRVEYFYLCEVIKKDINKKQLGIEGEFSSEIEVRNLSKEEFLNKIDLNKKILDKIFE